MQLNIKMSIYLSTPILAADDSDFITSDQSDITD
jgi:hypothetical protein